jgi:hypothetical protein
MRPRGPAGATSIAAAMGRLRRLGHVPAGLHGPAALDGLTARRLTELLEDPAGLGAAALEQVLGPVEALRGRALAPDGSAPRPVLPGEPRARAARPAPAPERAVRARSGNMTARPSGAAVPRPRTEAAAPTAGDAPTALEAAVPPLTSGSDRPAALAARPPRARLSRPARLGARTPVVAPSLAPDRVRSEPGPGAAWTPGRPSESPSSPLPELEPTPGSTSTPPPAPASGGVSAAPAPSALREPDERERPVAPGRGGGAAPAATDVPRHSNGTAPRAVEGLAGLVSWWDARDAARPPAAVPVETPRAVAFPADGGAWIAERATDAAPEVAPAARLSFRSALEELLVAEARASGIEVYP